MQTIYTKHVRQPKRLKNRIGQHHCVYVDYRNDTNQPFYVGCGKSDTRPITLKVTNPKWMEIYETVGVTTVVVADGFQKWYAYELEVEWILKLGKENLINQTHGGTVNAFKGEPQQHMSDKMKAKWEDEGFVAAMKAGKEKQKLQQKGVIAQRFNQLRCRETNQIFNTQLEAARTLGISQGNLSRHIAGELGNVKGYSFEVTPIERSSVGNSRPVECIETGERFNSMTLAAIAFGVSESLIYKHVFQGIPKKVLKKKYTFRLIDKSDYLPNASCQ